jgi:hypothetical protein
MQDASEYMTVRGYADHRRVSRQAIYQAIRQGRITVRNLCGLMVVPMDQVQTCDREAAPTKNATG